MARQLILLGQFQSSWHLELKKGESYIVGRTAKCQIVLIHPSVSRKHAQIDVHDAAISVTDLGSRNGTFVEDVPVTKGIAVSGQKIRFGQAVFLLLYLSERKGRSQPATDHGEEPHHSHSLTITRSLLTPAQARTFDLVIQGLAEKEIAGRLRLSKHTVHSHVRAIYGAFEVESRSELLARLLVRDEGGKTENERSS